MTVLITGIGRGIGQALAGKFLKEGGLVLGTYLSAEPDFKNKNLLVFKLDLSRSESIAQAAEEIKNSGYEIDILINNAGVLLDEEETGIKVDKLRGTLEVNLLGTVDFTERVLALVKDGGHIINISSRAGSLALASEGLSHYPRHYPAYKISKTALNMYTVTLARRLKDRGIIVSSVHPGWVRTEMGGEEADLSAEEAAEGIYKVAISKPDTGGFWFQNERLPW